MIELDHELPYGFEEVCSENLSAALVAENGRWNTQLRNRTRP